MKAHLRKTMRWKHTHVGRPSWKWYGGNREIKYWQCVKCGAFKCWNSLKYISSVYTRSFRRHQRKIISSIWQSTPLSTLLKKK